VRIPAASALTAIVLYASAHGPVTTDLEGRRVQPLSANVSVLLFTRTDCPISNRYAPELARMHRRFADPDTKFTLVYVDPAQSIEAMRRHLREYAYPFGAVVDAEHELVKLSKARTTPQAAVFRRGQLVYTGRIDDRYINYGRSRSAAGVHDLEDVLQQLAEGKPVPFRSTAAVGCFIEDVR
jgi:hypothetical protein